MESPYSNLSGQKINGSLNLKVSNKISPLEPLDIFLHLRYKNVRGDDKLKTSVKASPSYIAGVPVFCLKNNASTNQIRIGGRAKFSFDILMKRLISTLRVEVSDDKVKYAILCYSLYVFELFTYAYNA